MNLPSALINRSHVFAMYLPRFTPVLGLLHHSLNSKSPLLHHFSSFFIVSLTDPNTFIVQNPPPFLSSSMFPHHSEKSIRFGKTEPYELANCFRTVLHSITDFRLPFKISSISFIVWFGFFDKKSQPY